nr:MAG TPA: hypothetical protein [Caudoviricetes sp.]
MRYIEILLFYTTYKAEKGYSPKNKVQGNTCVARRLLCRNHQNT